MMGQRLRFRGLFRKYFLVLFLAVVVPLAANGVSEAWFGYRDQRARLDQLLGVEARSAASRIQGFVDGITNQLGWLVQLPWSEEPDERRRIDALRLLRQVPAIVSLTLVDGTGRERLYVSRDWPQPNREPHRPLQRARRHRSAIGADLVWRGQLLPWLRAVSDGRNLRQPTLRRRGCRRGQPQADLGRDLGHQGRGNRPRLRARQPWPAHRPSGHQPRPARSRRGHAETLPRRSGPRWSMPARELQPARTRRATPLRPRPHRLPDRTGRSWSSSLSQRPSDPSMLPCGGPEAFFWPVPPSQVCSPMPWHAE